MRMKIALSSTAIAVAGILTVWDVSAFAAPARTRACTGQYQAAQNGQCVNTRFANPNRSPHQDFTVFYRSKRHKSHKASSS